MENKVCKQCNADFVVEDEDLKFLDKVSPEFGGKKYNIPSPTLCSHCRLQRRLAWRNVRSLYRRKSDLTGRDLVSLFAPNSPFKTYHISEINSDNFDAIAYGQDYDLNSRFFDQWRELQLKVPRAHASVDLDSMENSEFVNLAISAKNDYMCFGVARVEDSYFCDSVWDSQKCMDCYFCSSCENSYQLVDCKNIYQGYYCRNCDNCREIILSIDLIGCQNCFGCAGLRNKQYCLNNIQLSKEDYEKKVAAIKLNKESLVVEEIKLREIYVKLPQRYTRNFNVENSSGDFLANCRNCRYSFDLNGAENSHYCNTVLNGVRDNMDVAFSADSIELGYEGIITSMNAYLVRFSAICFPGDRNIMYCDSCSHSSNLFGCVGLKRKQYCILNKQYSREEYETLVPKIIEKMMASGEWGEFFPLNCAPYAYNETTANEWYPLKKEQAVALGANWQDEDYGLKYDGSFYQPEDVGSYDPKQNQAAEVKLNELLEGIIKCEVSGKPFRVISQEVAFYIEHGLPIPTRHPNERYKERVGWRRPRRLYQRQCMCEGQGSSGKDQVSSSVCTHEGRCPNEFETTYAPERSEKVYCELCYQKSIL